MRALFERSPSVRAAVVLTAALCVMALARAAAAGDDPGLRRATLLPDQLLAAFGLSAPEPVRAAEREPVLLTIPVSKPRGPRRIWAAAHGRPLRIALARPRKLARSSGAPRQVAPRAARSPIVAGPFRLVPPPTRTALVSIYDDRTLRSGDAVMLDDGVHVFRGDGFWPHRPRDFVRLQFVAGLDWHLRRTLEPFDNNPPTRWTSIMVPPA